MKHLCILDQFSGDHRYLQENLYTPLHIFAMPAAAAAAAAAQGPQMTDPMSVCCSCSIQN